MRTMLKSKSWLLVTTLVALTLVVSACSVGVPAPGHPPLHPNSRHRRRLFKPPKVRLLPCLLGRTASLARVWLPRPYPRSSKARMRSGRSSKMEGWRVSRYEPGFEYKLKVLKETRANVPADTSRFTWTLMEVVNKTPSHANRDL